MHTCKTCASCMNLDMNLAYLTDPPQYKCKESGRLHFQFDVCDLSADTNIANIEYIRKEDAKSVTWEQPSYTDPLNVLTEVRDRIESIKPADVAPVRHGKWLPIVSHNNTYKCSECGRLLVDITDGLKMVAKHYPYCHCGAKMDAQGYEDYWGGNYK